MIPTPQRGVALLPGAARALDRTEPAQELEEAAVERVLRGDAGAYKVLVERHHRRVFALVYRLTGNRTDAEDLSQQAFLQAFVALGDFDPKRTFRAWINRIAVNLARDHAKSKKRTETALPDSVASSDGWMSGKLPDPEGAATGTERRAVLRRALASLSWKDREVLVLKDLEDLSYQEMRAILGWPVTALKIRVVRARRKLRDVLEGWGCDDV